MKDSVTRCGIAALALLWSSSAVAGKPDHARANPERPVNHADRVIVKFRPGVAAGERAAVHRRHRHEVDRILPQLDIHVVRVPPGRTAEHVVARYRHHPLVEFAEPDHLHPPAVSPNDTYYPYAWHHPQIGTPSAWEVTVGSQDVIIAVLDTGVDATHPELSGKVVAGWNVYDDNADTSDGLGHGTWVAGAVAAASNNAVGVASIAWECPIMPVRISDGNGWASDSAMAAGLVWAADHGARVANISYAGASTYDTVAIAADYFQDSNGGGVVVASAGNGGEFSTLPDNPFVLTVSATDQQDSIASFSNTGHFVDLSAPGVGIFTTGLDGSYVGAGGTSFSAPIVAGVAALAISANPVLAGQEVQSIVTQTADDLGPSGRDPTYGWGRVNAAQAVFLALDSVPNGDVAAPVARIVAPASGDALTGMVMIVAEATDDVGVTQVDLYCDNVLVSSDTFPPHEWVFDTTTVADGEHTFQAVAYDAADNSGESAVVSVTVDNSVPCDCPPDCGVAAASEFPGATCDDGLDNDCDGSWDCEDPDCDTDFACVVASCNDNGVCETGEDCLGCPGDCRAGSGAACGNGVCEPGGGENCLTCPVDCNGQQGGKPSGRFCCGDGSGSSPVGCGDSRCASDGFACSNDSVADWCCGDGVCTGSESGCNCAVDCGTPPRAEVIGSTCNDAFDNDCDGLVDCDEPECTEDPACSTCDGDGVCELGENCVSCPTDCRGKIRSFRSLGSRTSREYCCGNGVLEDVELERAICDGNP